MKHTYGLAFWLLAMLALPRVAHAAPAVFWASDPVRPAEVAMLIGEDFGPKPAVEVMRLPDGPAGTPAGKPFAWGAKGRRVEVLQHGGRSVKFVVPPDLPAGVYAYRVAGAAGATAGLLNRPAVWWAQGDGGTTASPGGWTRIFGKCLVTEQPSTSTTSPPRHPTLYLKGPKSLTLKAQGDGYALKALLPKELPPGEYRVYAHNGCGGSAAWGDPVMLTVAKPRAWPAQLFDVRSFGADGTGAKDDTAAVQAALAKAGEAGGGVVTFPRGRYQITEGLVVPRFTVLRGEGRELSCLFWPDVPKPPAALIQGSNSFGVETLTLYASNHIHVIAANQAEPDAGDVFVRGVRVRANSYRGHLKAEDANERLVQALRSSTGGGDSLRLGGKNVEVTGCDIYGSGRVLYLSRAQGARIAGNILYNGRWGWYCISGSDGVVLEDNKIIGGDLMSTGGGLNCLDGSTCSQNVYYARNSLSLMHGWDREAMTSDAGGGAYFGKVASAKGKQVVLAEDPQAGNRNWAGAGFFILDGRGRGQYRRVAAIEGRTVTLDAPWQVLPDETSVVTLTMLQRRYLFIGNDFSDAGVALQLYGMAIEHIADGNLSTRTAGFHNFGMRYGGIQPSWYNQWLNNGIAEGNSYRSGHDNYMLSGEAHLGIFALPPRVDFPHPLTLGCVARRNRLRNNAHIAVGGTDPYNPSYALPTTQEVVVEGNEVSDSDVGIFLRKATAGVLLRNNRFERVKEPFRDEVALLKAAAERLRKLMAEKGPIAWWSFEGMTKGGVPDASGHGFDARVSGGVAPDEGRNGRGARFTDESYLRLDEPMMLNLESLTLSLWIRPETVKGRHGLVGKRYYGTAAPYVFSLWDGGLEFEATDTQGNWSFNFRSPAVIKEGVWSHVAAVVERGKGVTLYANGQAVAVKENALDRVSNSEPLILGREAWAGVNNAHDPCYFQGVMDDVKVWARPLTADEIRAEAR